MPNTSKGRRGFLKTGLAATAAAGAASGIIPETAEASENNDDSYSTVHIERKGRRGTFTYRDGKDPHVFLITVDMISPDCYLASRELSRHIRLPNIRSIGDAGTRFENALCTIPLCGPSRASIFTGVYPPYLTNGERAPQGMKTDLDDDDPIFQEYLRAAGYQTKHIGKCHVGTHRFMDAFGENDAPWNRWAPPIMEDDDYAAFLRAKGVRPPRYRRELRGRQYDRTSPGNSFGGWIEQDNGADFPVDAHYSMFLADRAAGKIETARRLNPDAPVYMQLDFFDPHQPFSVPSGFEARAAELKKHVRLPSSYDRVRERDFQPLEGEPPIYSVYRQYWGAYDPELVRDYIVAHLLQMEVVDNAVGVVLEEIRRQGIWDDSLIIFTADHGEMNGRLGMFDKGVYFQPDIFRVPMFVKMPAGSGQTVDVYDRPVSNLDVSRTILGCAGIDTGLHADGEDLLPVMRGERNRQSDEHLFQTGWHVGVNYGIGMNIRDEFGGHYMYAYNITGGEEELYDMNADTSLNLIGDGKHRDLHVRAVRRMGEILSGDPRWLGYWSTFRLHRADMLPKSGGDMQMFVPEKK